MHASLWYARAVINQAHLERFGIPGTITSAFREQTPGGSSLHPLRRAMDVRTHDMPDDTVIRVFAEMIASRLGPDFDVVVEGPASPNPALHDRQPHIHVEYDPKEYAA